MAKQVPDRSTGRSLQPELTCPICGKENPKVRVGYFPNLRFCSVEHGIKGHQNGRITKALDDFVGEN